LGETPNPIRGEPEITERRLEGLAGVDLIKELLAYFDG
jgi:hypothetical protein